MSAVHNSRSPSIASPRFPLHVLLLMLLVTPLSYLAAKLGGTLVLRPQMVWPLWPGCALLVALLLLVPRKSWFALMVAGFAGFILYDLQVGLTLRATALLILADAVEVLTAAFGASYTFDGTPRLNTVRRLARYSFFAVVLAPLAAAFVASVAFGESSWIRWRIGFFTEALALLTVTPAILSWVALIREWRRKSRAFYREGAALLAAVIFVGYYAFVASGHGTTPVLLYALLPFLLWSALRFGLTGISTSMVAVAFLAILGAVHGRGPFRGSEPLHDVLSLQLFLLFTATPFMVLAVLVEERKQAEVEVRESQNQLSAVVSSATDAIITVDEQLRIVLFNASAEQMFKCGAQARTGRSIERFIPKRFSDEIADRIGQFGESGLTNRGMAHPTKLWVEQAIGEEFPIEASISQSEVDGRKLFTVIIRDISERRRAEQAIRESEERFRLVANTAPVLIWMSGPDKLCTYFNQPWLDFTGRSIEQELGNGWAESVHSEDLAECMSTYTKAFDQRKSFKMEYRLKRHDGEYRWVFDTGLPRFHADDSFVGYIGSCIDVTDRKLAEETLAGVSGRLIEAQEQERSRIGRELHDDIGQRLALLAVELQQIHRDLPDSPEIRSRMGELHNQTLEIAADLQSLSHELHSARLQYLGVAPAIRSFCQEFGERQMVEIDFKTHDLPSPLSPDTSLCFFRVLQEALHNSAKHSGAHRCEVRLWSAAGEIHLTVADFGSGFDIETARKGRGLGLISMEERLKLLKGNLSIKSQHKGGTTIHASAPLTLENDSVRAAG